jgi:hypothetical protein
MQNWSNKLAAKGRRLAIPNLMTYIVVSMGAVFILDLVFAGRLSSLLVFSLSAIQAGQIWRLISFIVLPPPASLLFIIFALYFYYLIGQALESSWGAARFTLFYVTGIAGSIVAGLITGFATNFYLNLSLFFAFAILFPDFELRLFFILPVKVKWLAYLNAAYFLYLLILSSWPQRVALLVALANIALFFWRSVRDRINNIRRRRRWKNHFR